MEHAKVTTVKLEDGIVYCNVRPVRHNVVYEGIPVLKTHSGFVKMPEQGDTVMLDELADGSKFITKVLGVEDIHSEKPTPSEIREGDLTLRLDGNTQLTFSKSNSGGYNIEMTASKDVTIKSEAEIKIEAGEKIDIDAGETIDVDSESDVDVDASGNIELDAGGDVNIQGVTFLDHTHDYDDNGVTKTSDPPNQ